MVKDIFWCNVIWRTRNPYYIVDEDGKKKALTNVA